MNGEMERLIRVRGAYNIRDLGGYGRSDGGATAWRAILRADGLHLLDDASVDLLVEEGVRLVIDLRGEGELRVEPNPFAAHGLIRYENVPLFDALAPIAVVAAENGGVFDMAGRYRQAIDHCGGRIARVLGSIADAPEGIVLFHCTAGKDRTGIIAALLLWAAGVDRDTITADYALTGTIAPDLIAALRARSLARGVAPALVDQFLTSHPETMRTMLDHVQSVYGGIDPYLAAIGLEGGTVARLRARLGSSTAI
jgi:protein-tyrosine phosphatase